MKRAMFDISMNGSQRIMRAIRNDAIFRSSFSQMQKALVHFSV